MNKLKYIPEDLVYVPKFSNSIYKVISCGTYPYEVRDMNDNDAITEESSIVPIPLTFEILEKNGWKLLKHHERDSYYDVSWSSYHKPAETNISLIFYPEEEAFFPFLYAQEISEKPIMYVHQLQHLLFGLGLNSNLKI